MYDVQQNPVSGSIDEVSLSSQLLGSSIEWTRHVQILDLLPVHPQLPKSCRIPARPPIKTFNSEMGNSLRDRSYSNAYESFVQL
jgi:hypothetical protein